MLIFLLNLFIKANGLFRLYNIDASYNNAPQDCLYSNEITSTTDEWILRRYCISEDDSGKPFECYGNLELTFEELKLRKISSEDLYKWNAPMDTIDNYERYLTENDIFMKNNSYCNCSNNFFGKDCSYSFNEISSNMAFHDVVLNAFKRKEFLYDELEIVNDKYLLTCYEGIKCKSIICLDWRQVCDGFNDCENGEDEFDECFLLEINQCQDNEYRCLNGMCIPKTFLVDLSYDCGDMTDEFYSVDEFQLEVNECYLSPMILCDFNQFRRNLFSCGDGQYEIIDNLEFTCYNGRDLFYRRNLFLASKNNLTFKCWFLMLCMSESDHFNLFDYDIEDCRCTSDNLKKKCFTYFNRTCPPRFYFQTENNFLYPFIKFMFDKTKIDSSLWWEPTHICFKNESCTNFLSNSDLIIDELICIEVKQIPDQSKLFEWLKILFSYCNRSIQDNRLYYCNKSQQFISKYRVEDSMDDCYYGEDEDDAIILPIMPSLNLTDRFKCETGNKSMVRTLISYVASSNSIDTLDNLDVAACEDDSHKLSIAKCEKPSDIACQFIRGTYVPSVSYIFRENCNGKHHIKFSIHNETDETNCEEWSANKCNNYWDLPNGIDEINCSDTVSFYLKQKVFNCNIDEHYCAFENGTTGCLSKERAGDGIIDCLGASDERKEVERNCSSKHIYDRFNCPSQQCVSLHKLCNKDHDCSEGYDEIICPWLFNTTVLKLFDFPCKNGTHISRMRYQCNEVIDCQPDGEDEWFCDLIYNTKQFSLNDIDEYPLMNIESSKFAITNNYHFSPTFSMEIKLFNKKNIFLNLYCNRGIIVQYRLSERKCLCPPSYYGFRCQYQAEFIILTIKIDIPISLSKYQNKHNSILLIARLILDTKVFDHEQMIHRPATKHIFYLNYHQLPPKKQGNWSVRLDAYLINTYDIHYKSSWLFYVPFSFLPVNRLALHLLLKDSETCNTLNCIHGICRKYLNFPHDDYCQCEENWSGKYCNEIMNCQCTAGGKCIEGHLTPICICPAGRIGKQCRIRFNPCADVICRNGGTCLPSDERQSVKFLCSCSDGYYGLYCERMSSRVHMEFSSSFPSKSFGSELGSVFVYFLRLQTNYSGILSVENRLLYKQIKVNERIIVYNNNYNYLSSFILVEIYFRNNISSYYIGAILKKNFTELYIKIDQNNRCPFVNELILNETIRKFQLRRKLKYYHPICEKIHSTKCFYDESSLCFCNKNHQPDCLIFQQESKQCSINYCQNNGQCVENIRNGIWDFACVCNGCSYGSLCQLMTSDYVLSFDVMLGQDLRTNMSFQEQPFIIKFVLIFIIFMILLGTVSNILSFVTFRQKTVRQYGCGIYLSCLPCIGQIGLFLFASRYFYLLITQLYNVTNHRLAYWICIILEYSLNVCPMLFDWLIVCIAVERCINLIKGISFKKTYSVWWAKRIIPCLTFIIVCSLSHELFIHKLIYDPRSTSEHTWCVIEFRWMWIKYYRLLINLMNLIVPGIINLIATIFLLHKTTLRKQKFVKKKTDKAYLNVFRKQLPMYGSPFGLIILSIMRVVFSLTLVCITEQWHKYAYFIAYFISFTPFMATFPIFVLTAKVYKIELRKVITRFVRNSRASWICQLLFCLKYK